MSDPALRAAVDQAIRRHLAARTRPTAPPDAAPAHPSHTRFALPRGDDDEGVCLIEPDVACTHCGYCQSYGH